MGKSPAKWISKILFGKKTSRSNSSKRKDSLKGTNNTEHAAGTGTALSGNSPVISKPVLVSIRDNGNNQDLVKGETSSLQDDVHLSVASQNVEKQEITSPVILKNAEELREEKAATSVQSAFRGYLARRAFRALKGIIRLQALIRGHLVRRQAIASLRATWALVKLQAVVRGKITRRLNLAHVNVKLGEQQYVVHKPLDSWKERISTTAYVCMLLARKISTEPLHFQYRELDPNSVFSWSERWTRTQFWKLVPQPKKATDMKPQLRKASYTFETESGKLKRNSRKNQSNIFESNQSKLAVESEKLNRNPRRLSNTPVESIQNNHMSELEKVKRNLRKVSSTGAEILSPTTEVLDCKTTKSLAASDPKVSNSSRETPDVEVTGMTTEASSFDGTHSILPAFHGPDIQDESTIVNAYIELVRNISVNSKSDHLSPEASVVTCGDQSDGLMADVVHVVQNKKFHLDDEENGAVVGIDMKSKDEKLPTGSLKTSRRTSLSTKPEYGENGSRNSPSLPSYMAATESAKAKLRGQGSPKFASDSAEKNGLTRRHSLPNSTNGKVSSQSPRTQRLVQGPGKGVKGDRSIMSSRDGNDRVVQVEWRR